MAKDSTKRKTNRSSLHIARVVASKQSKIDAKRQSQHRVFRGKHPLWPSRRQQVRYKYSKLAVLLLEHAIQQLERRPTSARFK